MGVKDILEFVKIEHTLFSLPFVFIGALIAGDPTVMQLVWILVAAVGARGLAMGLNRIIDRDIDAQNPRTAGRHLAAGTMSMNTAGILCLVSLAMLLVGAWNLNPICLYLSPIPVAAFVVYPYLKRKTVLCHLWLGLCLGLAPAGAWLGIVGDDLGWEAITDRHWHPTLFWIAFGVLCWIASFDLNYALMDMENDRASGIHSFPARFGAPATRTASILLTLVAANSFLFADPVSGFTFIGAVTLATLVNLLVVYFQDHLPDFQRTLFQTHAATGWVLLAGLVLA